MGRATYNNSFLVHEKQEFIHALLMYITELIHICTDWFSEKKSNQQMLKTAKATRLVIWENFKSGDNDRQKQKHQRKPKYDLKRSFCCDSKTTLIVWAELCKIWMEACLDDPSESRDRFLYMKLIRTHVRIIDSIKTQKSECMD